MSEYDDFSFTKSWKEYWGRKKIIEPIPFDDNSILTLPFTFKIGTPGYYIQLPSLTAAIVTSSTGQKQVFTDGGYKNIQEGAYTIQYIDLSERFFNFSRIVASTKDGSEVSLTISISYKINDPSQLINVSTPLQSLFSVCEAAIRNFIVTHHHDELISEPGNEQFITDNIIIQYVKDQVAVNQTCRAFLVLDVIIKDRYGDPEIGKVKHERLVQEKQNLTQKENVQQQQQIADEQRELELLYVEKEQQISKKEAEIKKIKAEATMEIQKIKNELEKERRAWQHQQELDISISHILEKMLTIPGYHPNTQELTLLYNRFSQDASELPSQGNATEKVPSEIPEQADPLTKTLLTLLNRRKPGP